MNGQNSLVSVIMPCYNSKKFLTETINSVIAQTYQNWEMIIVDDCSNDESYEIVLEYVKKDSRIKVHRMDHNSGAAICRNKAIELSQGDYVAFLDSDDLWLSEKLEKQLRFMQEHDCDFSFTEYEHINEDGFSLNIRAMVINKLTYKHMLLHCYTGCLTVMYKQDLLHKIYIPKVGNGIEDYALFLQVIKHTKNALGYPEVLAKYRIHTNSLSGKRRNKLKKLRFYFDVMLNLEHKNIVLTCFYLFTNQIIKLFWKYKKD